MIFNKYLVNLLFEIKERGYVTTKTQKTYISNIGFYIAMRWLRDHDLIKCNGVDNNNFKIWTLNERGERVVACLGEIRKILGVKNDKSSFVSH